MSTSAYFKKLDNLQKEIYTSLDSLTKYQPSEFDSTSTKRLHQQLLKYKDYLRICKTKLITNDEFNNFELYQLRYSSFKSKLHEILLENNRRESQLAHEFRIKQFGLDKPTAKPTAKPTVNQLSERDQLFGNAKARDSNKTISELSVNQQIAHHNKQITQSLQTSRQLLSATILQSELNLDSLDQQTKDLHKLNENFIQFSNLLQKSQQIVKFIEKQDKSDRQRIYMAIAFFLGCCCWVIYRRILRRPIKIMLWSFFKLFGIFNWLTSKDDTTSAVLSSTLVETVSTMLETSASEGIVEDLTTSSIVESTTTLFDTSTTELSTIIMDELLESEESFIEIATSLISTFIETTTYIQPRRIIDEL